MGISTPFARRQEIITTAEESGVLDPALLLRYRMNLLKSAFLARSPMRAST